MSEWQSVVGYEGKYEVSSVGDIRHAVSGKPVGTWKSDQGYMVARLSGPRKMVKVHRLVAQAFIPNPQEYPAINHIDFDRANNSLANLEWCTQKQNLAHSDKAGRMNRTYWKGRRSPNAYLQDDVVGQILDEYALGGKSLEKLGKQFKISKRTIGRIVRGQTYRPSPPTNPTGGK